MWNSLKFILLQLVVIFLTAAISVLATLVVMNSTVGNNWKLW